MHRYMQHSRIKDLHPGIVPGHIHPLSIKAKLNRIKKDSITLSFSDNCSKLRINDVLSITFNPRSKPIPSTTFLLPLPSACTHPTHAPCLHRPTLTYHTHAHPTRLLIHPQTPIHAFQLHRRSGSPCPCFYAHALSQQRNPSAAHARVKDRR